MNARRGLVMVALCAAGSLAGAQANPNPMDSIRKLPGYRPAHDSVVLLARDRIAKTARVTWGQMFAYLDRSSQLRATDSIAI